MSTQQRNDACVLAVDPVVAGTLRTDADREAIGHLSTLIAHFANAGRSELQ